MIISVQTLHFYHSFKTIFSLTIGLKICDKLKEKKRKRESEPETILFTEIREITCILIVAVWSLSHVQLFATPWTAACQASLFFTVLYCLPEFAQTHVHLISASWNELRVPISIVIHNLWRHLSTTVPALRVYLLCETSRIFYGILKRSNIPLFISVTVSIFIFLLFHFTVDCHFRIPDTAEETCTNLPVLFSSV